MYTFTVRGKTQSVPIVEFKESKETECLNERHASVNRLVANLSAPQIKAFYACNDINTFFPHTGLFLSDFAVGTHANALLKRLK